MCENTRGRVTFLVNLILSRLEKFDLSMLGWGGRGGGEKGGEGGRGCVYTAWGLYSRC